MAKADKLRVASLERSPCHLLHGALQLALDIYAEELGPGAVTQRQFAVLAAVAEREGLSQTDLVRATGVDRSTLADMVARMIAKGLLDRARSSTDGRANTVRLTDVGREALDEARPRVEAADARLLGLLSTGKRDGFVNQLRNLSRANEAVALGGAERLNEAAPARKKKSDGKAKDAGKKSKKGKKARRAAADSSESAAAIAELATEFPAEVPALAEAAAKP